MLAWFLAHLDILSRAAVLIGIPVGLFQFWLKVRQEKRDRDYGTYNALDDKYISFQQLCLAHPQLDIFDIPDAPSTTLTSEQRKQELVALTLLFSIFERAFLMYLDRSKAIRQRQWTGWQTYLTSYCARSNFRRAWEISGHTFDAAFQEHMKACMATARRAEPAA